MIIILQTVITSSSLYFSYRGYPLLSPIPNPQTIHKKMTYPLDAIPNAFTLDIAHKAAATTTQTDFMLILLFYYERGLVFIKWETLFWVLSVLLASISNLHYIYIYIYMRWLPPHLNDNSLLHFDGSLVLKTERERERAAPLQIEQSDYNDHRTITAIN